MSKFDEMICGLQQDVEVPEEVWTRYTGTLAMLPDRAGQQEVRANGWDKSAWQEVRANRRNKSGQQAVRTDRWNKSVQQDIRANRWIRYASSAAAVVIVGSAVCCANPALAAKIPLIGGIFGEVQQDATFSGEYDSKAEALNTERRDEADPNYTAEDAGVTFTASEIYCDGLSVFLTAEVKAEQGGLNDLPGRVMYLEGSWRNGPDGEKQQLVNNYLEGQAVDDQTFIGMVKLDLDDYGLQEGTVELNLSMIGYDDAAMDGEDNDAFHKIEGGWSLTLPFTVDTEAARTIEVNQEKDGYRLEKVFVSPYQVITYTDVPYTENEITREEFDAMMMEKTDGAEDPGLTYEEYLEQEGKSYAECSTVVFTQDGEMLSATKEQRGCSVNAVQGKEISKLYIYVFDHFDGAIRMSEQGMDGDAAKQALIAAEVDVK